MVIHPREKSALRLLAETCRRSVGSVLVDMRIMAGTVSRARGELNLRLEVTMKEEDERAIESIRGIFEEALVEQDFFCELAFHTGIQRAGESLLS